MVGNRGEALDVGCSTGLLASELVKRGYSVVGIEMDHERAKLAERFCHRVVVTDIASERVFENAGGPFELIIFGDILEHLIEPEIVLRRSRAYLKPGGYVIISIPNIANYRIRWRLFLGRFGYEDEGLLDRTHLRFFTLKTFLEMIREAGFDVREIKFAAFRMPAFLLRFFPRLLAVQFVFKLTPSNDADF
jgi:2-polyprenyl-3-methyl-5-hydroxy-6-metoxy-1,4-benzoquinol methylase